MQAQLLQWKITKLTQITFSACNIEQQIHIKLLTYSIAYVFELLIAIWNSRQANAYSFVW